VVEIGGLDLTSSEAEILTQTLEVERRQDARDDAERVARVLDAYRAGGLGMIGRGRVKAALDNGQVHELILVADPARLEGADGTAIADALVAKARQTGARVTFVEDAALLQRRAASARCCDFGCTEGPHRPRGHPGRARK